MKASCTKVVPTNWNTYISASLYPLVLPIESIESITWAHRGWGRQRFIEGDPFAHVWPQQPNQAMQSKTNTALQTDSKFFKYIASTEHYCVVVLVVDRGGGRAEGQLRGEYGWAGRSRAGRQGRAQPGFSGILFPMCVLYTHGSDWCKVEWFCCFEWLAAAEETLRHWSCSCRPGAKQTKAFPSSELFSMSMFRRHILAGCIHYQISKTFMAWTITYNELF